MPSPPPYTQPIDTSKIPGFFSRFPVRMSRAHEAIHRITLAVTPPSDPRSMDEAIPYVQLTPGPDVKFYPLLCAGEDLEKVRLVIEFSEMLWAHDDITEYSSADDALSECEKLRRAMKSLDSKTSAPEGRFQEVCSRVKEVYPRFWPGIVDAMEEYLLTEGMVKEWASLEEYLQFRKVHVGNTVMLALLRWERGIILTKQELDSVKEYTDEIGIWYGLANDYLSWKRERLQPADKIVNSVDVLMRQHNVPEKLAIDMVRGLIVQRETKLQEMKREVWAREVSEEVLEYVDSIDYYCGGMFLWNLRATRNTQAGERR